jgi:hypothetical protein
MTRHFLTSLSDSVNENFNFLIEKKQRTAAPNAIDYRCSQNKILYRTKLFIKQNPEVSTKDRLPFPVKNNVKKIVQLANIPMAPKVLLNHYLSQNYDLDYTSLRIISAKTGLSVSTIQRANKWLNNAKILVEKDLGAGRLKCRQVNLRIADWSIQPIEKKQYFFDTRRNVLGQIDQLIGVNLKPNTSIKRIEENKQKTPMPNVMEIDKRQKEIDEKEHHAQLKKRAKLEQKAQEAIEPLINHPTAKKAGFNKSHLIQLTKTIANIGPKKREIMNGKALRIDMAVKCLENIIKGLEHPLGKEEIKNAPNLVFGQLRKGLIYDDPTRTFDRKLEKRQEEARKQVEDSRRRREWELEQQKLAERKPEKAVSDPWLIVRSYLDQTGKGQNEDNIRRQKQLDDLKRRRGLL